MTLPPPYFEGGHLFSVLMEFGGKPVSLCLVPRVVVKEFLHIFGRKVEPIVHLFLEDVLYIPPPYQRVAEYRA